ncbi:hypothetical protein QFC21_000798 [Naganishia friedmannii]|uniref:Uncharacterized protein n=1 Tax=Naganishia friedmannii TaxID=89922 RepID=A0ACC2W6K6_9TREE|nr:hypothetical protein QFC21_000798 [Naganishia friedmannii]
MSSPLLQQFPQLSTFTDEQLKELLTNDEYLEAFLYTLPPVVGVLDRHEQLSRENEALAKQNLAMQDQLMALRASTASAYATAQHLQDRWKEVEQKQAGLYSKYRPSFLHLRLRHATSDQDALTETMVSNFIEGPGAAAGTWSGGMRGTPPSRVDSPASGFHVGGERDGQSADTGTMTPNTHQSLDEFIRTLKAGRKVYHKRALWCERWTRGEVAWRED